MDYGTLGNIAQAANNTMPELGRLKAAAERVNTVQHRLACFIERFHGPVPETASDGANAVAPSSYRNDLESLFVQIERLESTAAALDVIG